MRRIQYIPLWAMQLVGRNPEVNVVSQTITVWPAFRVPSVTAMLGVFRRVDLIPLTAFLLSVAIICGPRIASAAHSGPPSNRTPNSAKRPDSGHKHATPHSKPPQAHRHTDSGSGNPRSSSSHRHS